MYFANFLKKGFHYLCLALFGLLFLISKEVKATHIMGGEITYRYLGFNNQTNTFNYRIRINILVWAGAGSNYQPPVPPNTDTTNAGAIAFPNDPQFIAVYGRSNNRRLDPGTARITPRKGEVRPDLPRNCNPLCLQNVRIWYNTFEYTANLPFDANGYTIVYETADRNDTRNLGPGNGVGITFQTIIPSPAEFPNSSPEFTDLGIPFMLAGIDNTFINTAVDPDGDRLQFRFGSPIDGVRRNNPPIIFNQPPLVPFVPGFTFDQPLGTEAGVINQINSSTGLSLYRVNIPGQYNVVVEVLEFRARPGLSDTLIGITRRELQFVVREIAAPGQQPNPNQCPPNDPPRLATPNFQSTYTIQEGQALSFPINYIDSATDSISIVPTADIISGTNGYTGVRATMPISRGLSSTGTLFNWTPACGTRGTYNVRVSATDNGCPSAVARNVVVINILPYRAPTSIQGVNNTCSNINSYTYRVTNRPSGNSVWRISGGTILSNANNSDSVRVRWTGTTGFVRLVCTSALGCKDSVQLNINNNLVTPVSAGADVRICQGGSTTLSASGGTGVFVWSPATGLSATNIANPVARPTQTTTYVVAQNSANGCIARDTIVVRVDRIPNTFTDKEACAGEPISLGGTAVGGFSYEWLNTTGFTTAANIANPTTVLDAVGGVQTFLFPVRITQLTSPSPVCSFLDTVVVRVSPKPTIPQLRDTTICSGTTLTISSPTQTGFTYRWVSSDGQTINSNSFTRTFNNLGAAPQNITYILTASIATANCPGRDTIVIRVNPEPSLGARSIRLCKGNNIALNNTPNANFRYRWTPSTFLSNDTIANPTFFQADAGSVDTLTYSVVVTNRLTNCTKTEVFGVRFLNNPGANAAGPDVIACPKEEVSLGMIATTDQSFLWTILPNSDSRAVLLNNPIFVASSLSVRYGNPTQDTLRLFFRKTSTFTTTGCSSVDTVMLTIKPEPIPFAFSQDSITICPGSTLSLGELPNPRYSYSWSGSNLNSNAIANPLLVAVNTTRNVIRQQYIVTKTDIANGCINRDTVIVRVNPNPVVRVGAPNVVCSEATLRFGELPPAGEVPPLGFAYRWSPGAFLSDSTAANPIFRYAVSGRTPETLVYKLVVTNRSTNCADSAIKTVVINPLPIASIGADVVLCSEQSVTFAPVREAGIRYTWRRLSADQIGFSETLSNAVSANATLRGINRTNAPITTVYAMAAQNLLTQCLKEDTIRVTFNPLPQGDILNPDTIFTCSNVSTTLSGPAQEAALSYRWEPSANLNNDTLSNPTFLEVNNTNNTVFRSYILTTTFKNTGCEQKDTIVVGVNPLPQVSLLALDSVCSGETKAITLVNNPIFRYQWRARNGTLSNDTVAAPIYTRTIALDAPAALDTLTLVVTNRRTNCVNTFTTQFKTLSKPNPEVGPIQNICEGDSFTVGTPAISGKAYRWLNISGNPSSATLRFPSANNSDTVTRLFFIRETRNLADGCATLDTAFVNINPTIVQSPVIFSTRNVCPNVQGINYKVNGLPGYTYTWVIIGGTIASGQGTDSIFVNWGGTNNGAIVKVTPTSNFGCVGKADSVIIIINDLLKPITPSGDSRLCTAENLEREYSTPFTNGSTYTWFANNLGIVDNSTQGTNRIRIRWSGVGEGKVWVRENSVTSTDRCEGFSDTLRIFVNPSPSESIAVEGDTDFCFTAEIKTYRLDGFDGSNYAVAFSDPAAVSIVSPLAGDSIRVRFTQAGNFTVSFTETTDSGCVGTPKSIPVKVFELPNTTLSNSYDSLLCATDLNNKPYSIRGLPGSVFFWNLEGGEFINDPNGTGDTLVRINWFDTGIKELKVLELTRNGCTNDSLTLPVRFDASELITENITRDEDNDSLVIFTMRLANELLFPDTGGITIARRLGLSDFNTTARLRKDALEFREQLDNDTTAFEYRASAVNQCGTTLSDSLFRLLTLQGRSEESAGRLSLSWNRFIGWPTGVDRYEIWRQVDDEPRLELLSAVSGSALSATLTNIGDGFRHTLRIRAIQNNGSFSSWSNRIVLNFENQPVFGNFISPKDGDGVNDRVIIRNLKLYPNNRLRVFNRYGGLVYEKANYDDSFNGEGLPAGLYYLEFTAEGEKSFSYKGQLSIL